MTNIGWVELLVIIAAIAVLVLVPKRLLHLARRLRRWIRHLRSGSKGGGNESGESNTDAPTSSTDE